MKLKFDTKFGLFLAALLVILYFTFSYDAYYFPDQQNYIYIFINVTKAVAVTNEKFLSVALDTSFMRHAFHNLSDNDLDLLSEYAQHLSPAYLRLGGNEADQLLFTFTETVNDSYASVYDIHLKEKLSPVDYLNVSGLIWIRFNDFVKKSNLNLLLDLNVLLRNGSQWDSSNAMEMLSFSDQHGLEMDFQLGNEPNAFKHVFNMSVSASQLAKDFVSLRNVLDMWERYRNSKLVGPDVTRPRGFEDDSMNYLNQFLEAASNLSAVSWHQYYLNGRTASLSDFLDPRTFEFLPKQIAAVTQIVRQYSDDVPIWLTETSTAYGGGAPGLSDRFAASFLWLDKLGLAASMGIGVVIRQTLFKNHYALIDEDFTPLPDYWISLFYKLIIGRTVLSVQFPRYKKEGHLRFYSHCLKTNPNVTGNVVLVGINFGNTSEYIIPGGLKIVFPITPLIFTAPNDDLTSKSVLLNGKPLNFTVGIPNVPEIVKTNLAKLPLHVPPYSLGFWIFHGPREGACSLEDATK